MPSILGLPPRVPTPTSRASPTGGGGGDRSFGSSGNRNSPNKNNESSGPPLLPNSDSSSRTNSRSSSPFFGLVMPTPSFEKFLPNGGGSSGGISIGRELLGCGAGGSSLTIMTQQCQQPPPMPLSLSVDATCGGSTIQSSRKSSTKSTKNKPVNKTSKRKKKNTRSPLPRDALLPQSYSLDLTHPPPLMSLPTDDAEDAIGSALCGGTLASAVGYCEGPFPHGSSDLGSMSMNECGGAAHTLVMNCDSEEVMMENANGAVLLTIAEKVDVEPYAVRHDEIVTALIDEAVKNGNDSGTTTDKENRDAHQAAAVAASSPATATTVETTSHQPPPSIERMETGDRMDTAVPSVTMLTDPLTYTKGSAKSGKPRSPYRMTKNLSKLSSTKKMRKRGRTSASKSEAVNDTGNHGGRRKGTHSSPTPSRHQSMTLKINSASELRNSTPTKDMIQRSPLTASVPNNNNNFSTVKNPVDYFHPQCMLMKESPKPKSKLPGFGGMNGNNSKGKNKNNHQDENAPSAMGKEATLEKLNNKLSMLVDIESGKFGKAAEMLRSDAVAFALRGGEEDPDDDENTRAQKLAEAPVTKVETRSILTLRMGFVSMSYGILLQWDCASQMVELIVLRKMCRDDFLKRKGENDRSDQSYHSISASNNRRRSDASLVPANGSAGSKSNRPPKKLPPKPALIPVPASLEKGSNHSIDVEVNPFSPAPRDRLDTSEVKRSPFSRLSLPSNPLPRLPRMLSGLHPNPPASDRLDSFLCVSVLDVKQLHGGCNRCSTSNRKWRWQARKEKSNDGPKNDSNRHRHSAPASMEGTTTSAHTNNPHACGNRYSRHHFKHRQKRKQTIRPYIRFELGRHEHCTKITKFNHGHPVWSKRHHNSCLLPCPVDDVSRFAGREDLTVEVRNNWKIPGRAVNVGSAVKVGGNWQSHGKSLFGSKSSETDDLNVKNQLVFSESNDDPILAKVTVPLSAMNIEDDDGGNTSYVGNNSVGEEEGGEKFKRRTTTNRAGVSSTIITIPLRMSSCPHAPIGSISLNITIKKRPPSAAADESSIASPPASVVSPLARVDETPLFLSTAPPLPSFNVDLSGLQVDINISGGSGSFNGEPKVNESIELGPLSRLMESWSFGGGSVNKEEPPAAAAASKDNVTNRGRETAAATKSETPSERKSKSPGRSRSFSPRSRSNRTTNTNDVGGNVKKRKLLRWSKRFDHQTKKWSSLKTPTNAALSPVGGATTQPTASGSANGGPPNYPSRNSSTKKLEEGNSTNNDGWFAFLNRESARDVVAGNAGGG